MASLLRFHVRFGSTCHYGFFAEPKQHIRALVRNFQRNPLQHTSVTSANFLPPHTLAADFRTPDDATLCIFSMHSCISRAIALLVVYLNRRHDNVSFSVIEIMRRPDFVDSIASAQVFEGKLKPASFFETWSGPRHPTNTAPFQLLPRFRAAENKSTICFSFFGPKLGFIFKRSQSSVARCPTIRPPVAFG